MTPRELDELRQPLYVASRRLLPDTEGPGERTGAPSIQTVPGPAQAAGQPGVFGLTAVRV